MNAPDRTPEEPKALFEIQQSFPAEVNGLLAEFQTMLADVPPHDIDRECNNLGHILMTTLTKTAPQLSEAMAYGLPFAFIELLRTRMRPPN
jgi:hypothetical protein